MKARSWYKYLLYIVLISVAVILKGFVEDIFQKQVKETYQPEIYMPIFSALVTQMIGIAMGLEFFYKQLRMEGKWRINRFRLIILGLPSLYLGLTYVIAFLPGTKILYQPVYELFGNVSFITVFQILFGYVFITSFEKGKISKEQANHTEKTKEYEEVKAS